MAHIVNYFSVQKIFSKQLWKQDMKVMFVDTSICEWRQDWECKVILADTEFKGSYMKPCLKNKSKQSLWVFWEKGTCWVQDICDITSLCPHNTMRWSLLEGTRLFPRELPVADSLEQTLTFDCHCPQPQLQVTDSHPSPHYRYYWHKPLGICLTAEHQTVCPLLPVQLLVSWGPDPAVSHL